ncbi:MAG: anion permease [Gemmatimonadota bacterium]
MSGVDPPSRRPSFRPRGGATLLSLLLFAATCFLAYANGANDNFKGVASLFGSDTSGYRNAILWGTVTTFLGSAASFFVARGLLAAFSGKGLVPDAVAGGELFLFAVAAGAGGTVILATLLGFPISTTHGLVGAILGAGLLAAGGEVNYGALTSTFFLPLLASPFLAVALAGALYGALHRAREGLGIEKDLCVCVGQAAPSWVPVGSLAAMTDAGGGLQLAVDREVRCEERYVGDFLGLSWQRLVDGAHYLSGGLVGFARGLNDTPKVAALLLVLRAVEIRWGLLIVGLAMAAGGLLQARRVAETMGRRITEMSRGQGFAANLATSLLVIGASRLALPVSTTHVSVGSLFGIGLATRRGNPGVARNVVLSWVVTLPCAAGLAALVYWVGTTGL